MSVFYTHIHRVRQCYAGQSGAYPELFAVIGFQVPDLRGLFLRGYGSQTHVQNNGTTVGVTATLHESGQLGQIQGDAARNISSSITDLAGRVPATATGAFSLANHSWWTLNTEGSTWAPRINVNFDSKAITPTSVENRPVNQAVRYLVRARP